MNKLSILLISFSFPLIMSAQEFKVSGSLQEIFNNIPEGFAVLDTAFGDLNTDNIRDMVIIFKQTDEEIPQEDAENSPFRPMLIYIGQVNETFILKAINDKVVLCFDCGGVMGDPYSDLVIKKGSFTLFHYGGSAWRWTRDLTFTYAPKEDKWLLTEDKDDWFHVNDSENIETKIRTPEDFGLITFEEFDVFSLNE